MRAPRLLALALLAVALALAACGRSEEASISGAMKLSREDLLAVCAALEQARGSTASEVAASKQAWRAVADGLPRVIPPATRAAIEAAAARGSAIGVPAVLTQSRATALTGPAAEVAGLFRTYLLLSTRGWRLLAASVGELESGSREAALFGREDAALYIESIYDGHFTLAQIGKKLLAAYGALGGAQAFGATLTPSRVSALVLAYSEASDRLHPHAGVRLGS